MMFDVAGSLVRLPNRPLRVRSLYRLPVLSAVAELAPAASEPVPVAPPLDFSLISFEAVETIAIAQSTRSKVQSD